MHMHKMTILLFEVLRYNLTLTEEISVEFLSNFYKMANQIVEEELCENYRITQLSRLIGLLFFLAMLNDEEIAKYIIQTLLTSLKKKRIRRSPIASLSLRYLRLIFANGGKIPQKKSDFSKF